MTTTSLHGSSSLSFVALKKEKKDNRNPPRLAIASEGVGCRHCRGCRRRQTATTSLHGSLLLLAFVDLKKKMIKTHPVSKLQAVMDNIPSLYSRSVLSVRRNMITKTF